MWFQKCFAQSFPLTFIATPFNYNPSLAYAFSDQLTCDNITDVFMSEQYNIKISLPPYSTRRHLRLQQVWLAHREPRSAILAMAVLASPTTGGRPEATEAAKREGAGGQAALLCAATHHHQPWSQKVTSNSPQTSGVLNELLQKDTSPNSHVCWNELELSAVFDYVAFLRGSTLVRNLPEPQTLCSCGH